MRNLTFAFVRWRALEAALLALCLVSANVMTREAMARSGLQRQPATGPAKSPAPASQQSQQAASPDQVVQEFYDWYLRAHFPEPKRQNLLKFRKYITERFLKRAMAPDVDSDLFIDAQDNDDTWADNFSVSKATIGGSQATVQVALNGKEMKYKLRVTLRRENAVWKIDSVKGSQ